jgi:hypothetical protein
MLEFRLESISLPQYFFQWSKDVFLAFHGLAALLANQVMVMPFLGMVIYKLAVSFAFINASGFFQQVQRTVYSRFIYTGHLFLYARDNFLRRYVGFGVVDNIDDQSPLGS